MLKKISKEMYGGEIIALNRAGGQRTAGVPPGGFLSGEEEKSRFAYTGKGCLCAGDRKKEGIFPLWSITDNTIISKIARGALFAPISTGRTNEIVEQWNQRLKTKCASNEDLITSLSGGNQQKVAVGKWLAADCDIYIFERPNKGVGCGAKQDIIHLINQIAKQATE